MTWLRGMQWKTSWRRERPATPPTTLTGVWAFNAFQNGGVSEYQLPLVTPAPARTLPFWVGMLAVVTDPASPLSAVIIGNNDGAAGINMTALFGAIAGPPAPNGRRSDLTLQQAPSLTSIVTKPALGTARQAVVVLIEAHAISGTQYVVNYWFDKFVALTLIRTLPFTASAAIWRMQPNGYALNGVAAGITEPTYDEIQTWFDSTKAQGEVRPIAGKTSDRWTATSVQPLVPAVLPNLGGGQAANFVTLGGPPGANTLFQVAFGY